MKKVVIAIILMFIPIFICSCFHEDDIEVANFNGSAKELPVLMYHSVDDTNGPYSVTEKKLEQDFKGLKEQGYTAVSFQDVIDYVYEGKELPEKPIVITFDDGYENNYTTLLPLAEKMDMKFEVFAVAGFLKYHPNAMVWEQAKELHESYHGNIGCHTHNLHSTTDDGRVGVVRLKGEDFRVWESLFRTDLRIAETIFNDEMGAMPNTFAYPNGSFSAEADKILRESGYLLTVVTEPGVNRIEKGNTDCLYLMMRISMDGKSNSALSEIEKYKNIHTTEAIEKAKEEIRDIDYASRTDALNALYGDTWSDRVANMEYINVYADLKYEKESVRELFAKCVEHTIVSGYSDWTMRPKSYITRGEFAVLLAMKTGYDGSEAEHSFTDSEQWNDWALSWCSEKGYMQGYGDDLFGVNDFLTKEQIEIVCERLKTVISM